MNKKASSFLSLIGLIGIFIIGFSSFNIPDEPVGNKKTSTPKVDQDDMDKYQQYYWFYISVSDNRRAREYTVKRVQGTKIVSGLIADYERSLWENLVAGRLAIGPFIDFEEAKGANKMYDFNQRGPVVGYIHSDEVNWFFVKVKINERAKSYRLEPTAAKVASGVLENFSNVLREGLTFQQLAIGPFWDYDRAEDAKRLYSKEH